MLIHLCMEGQGLCGCGAGLEAEAPHVLHACDLATPSDYQDMITLALQAYAHDLRLRLVTVATIVQQTGLRSHAWKGDSTAGVESALKRMPHRPHTRAFSCNAASVSEHACATSGARRSRNSGRQRSRGSSRLQISKHKPSFTLMMPWQS